MIPDQIDLSHTTECWGFSVDPSPESWCGMCRTREQAVREAPEDLGLKAGDTFWIQRGRIPHVVEFLPRPDSFTEEMREIACALVGDAAEEAFSDVDAEVELQGLLVNWAEKHFSPLTFWVADGEPEHYICVQRSQCGESKPTHDGCCVTESRRTDAPR